MSIIQRRNILAEANMLRVCVLVWVGYYISIIDRACFVFISVA